MMPKLYLLSNKRIAYKEYKIGRYTVLYEPVGVTSFDYSVFFFDGAEAVSYSLTTAESVLAFLSER